jgi:rhodanese-related sulfurtransferase
MKKFKILQLHLMMLLLLMVNNSFAKVGNLSADELIAAQKQGVVIIDIRTPEEWQDVGTVPNSERIMFYDQDRKPLVKEFMAEFEKVVADKDQPFILVCRTGSRTGRVTKFLDQQMGYTQGAHLAKGMKKWVAEKREVEKK